MAKQPAAKTSEDAHAITPDEPSPLALAAERQARIKGWIHAFANACSYDMSKDAIFGRVVERLTKSGVTDEEIAEHMKGIRAECEAHVIQRNAARDKRAAALIASMKGKTIQDLIN
jgi:hypothetical protein